MSADPTVHVAAYWDEDAESWWFTESEPGTHDDESRVFDGPVDEALWKRRAAILQAWLAVNVEIAAALDLDDEGRHVRPCNEWTGSTFPGTVECWEVVCAAPGDAPTRSRRGHRIGFLQYTEADAAEQLAALPDEFWLHLGGRRPEQVTKDRLSIVHNPPGQPHSFDCNRCGWPQQEHQA